MITLHSWRALNQLLPHRPFIGTQRIYSDPNSAWDKRASNRDSSVWVTALYWGLLTAAFFPMIFIVGYVAFLLITPLAPLLLLLSHNFDALRWLLAISKSITRERSNGTLDLLALAQDGHWNVSWRIAAKHLQHDERLEQHYNYTKLYIMFVALVLGTVAITDSRIALLAMIYVAILYIDRLHSTVLAVLLAMLLPQITTNRRDLRLMTIGGFLFVQVITYALTWVAFMLASATFKSFTPLLSVNLAALSVVSVFFFIRETTINALWQRLRRYYELPSNSDSKIDWSENVWFHRPDRL